MIQLNAADGSVVFYVNPAHIICLYEDEHEGEECTMIHMLHPLPNKATILGVRESPEEIVGRIYRSNFGEL